MAGIAGVLRITLLVEAIALVLLWTVSRNAIARWVVGPVVLVFVLLMGVELAHPMLGARGRAWLVIVDSVAISAVGFALVGFISGPALVACVALVVARVFLGRRELMLVVIVMVGLMALITWSALVGVLPWEFPAIDTSPENPLVWLRTGLVSILMISIIGALVGDITDRMERVLVQNEALLREARRATRDRDEFLAIASHELRTPLTTLKLACEALARRRGPLTPEGLQGATSLILRNIDRLSALVGRLLDVSRVDRGGLEITLEEVDLSAVVRDAAELFVRQPSAEGLFSFDLEPALIGRWDRSQLGQATLNLLSNALKYGAGNPVEVTTRRSGSTAVLVVRDRGVGISPEALPRIFERFFRGAPPSEGGGFGIGLFLVKSIVEGLDGVVRVESQPGEGSTFTVELPMGSG